MFSILTAFRWSVRLAALAAPHLRSFNRGENERRPETSDSTHEEHLRFAIEEADRRRHTVRRVHLRLALAEVQRKQENFADAEATIRQALEVTARVVNPSGYLQCLDALAEVFHDAGNFPAMEAALEKGLRVEASIPHPDPLRMARRTHRLGTTRVKNGRPEDAVPALEKALKLYEQCFGYDHLFTANLLGELGVVYRSVAKHAEAQQALRRALRIHERELGHASEDAVRDLHQLAGSLEESGDVESAVALYERALLLKERIVGGDLEELAEMQFGLAGMYIGWSKYARARELLAEAVGTFKRKKGPRLAVAYETVAHVEECSGRYLEAVAELAKAAKIWESDGRHPELVANMEHRAELLDMLRKRSEADWLRGRAAALLESNARAAGIG